MQTERNRACSKLLRCSLSYAKIIKKTKSAQCTYAIFVE